MRVTLSDAPDGLAALSPDGTRIAYAALSGALRVALANGGANAVILDRAQALGGIAWSR